MPNILNLNNTQHGWRPQGVCSASTHLRVLQYSAAIKLFLRFLLEFALWIYFRKLMPCSIGYFQPAYLRPVDGRINEPVLRHPADLLSSEGAGR